MKGQQELLYVVPFVAKVLESSLRSVVIIQFSLPVLLSGVKVWVSFAITWT